MSKINYLDFVKYVENNRKRLITHCRENGKDISEKDNLYDIVTSNNEINIENKYKVEFIDLDGSHLALTQYVDFGGKATLPNITPSFDSEYLEFVQWRTSGDDSLDNVTRDILVMPEYQVKYDDTTGQRPTYLICYFDDKTLSPTFYFDGYSAIAYVNAYIDYGDGTVEQITKISMSHTYAKKGLYTIKIYGDKYRIGGQTSYGLFNNAGYQYALLKAYLGNNNYISNDTFNSCFSLTNITLSNSITSISVQTFRNCHSLNNIIMPNSITNIGSNAFASCSSLTNIIMSNSITSIDSSAFNYCYSLTNIVLPNSITSIGNEAFYYCHSLTNITLPNSITSIGRGIFSYCHSLTNITLSNSITSISNNTFYECYSLNNIIMPNSITSIGDNVFYVCYSLTNITLPSSITSISNNTFAGCASLTNVTLPNDFNVSLSLPSASLSTECLVNMANALKDNTGETAKTLTLSKSRVYSRANSLIYLNANGEQVSKDTEGAMTLVEYIQNKNWTVTFR